KIMEDANVPVVPGSSLLHDVEEACKVANEIGFPVMVKAAAGGGGIGMEIVGDEESLRVAFTNNQERARNFFGNDQMFLEKYIAQSRHIEVQVMADKHGNGLHLFERECSIQRRNQKVIEETPAAHLGSDTKQAMYDAA